MKPEEYLDQLLEARSHGHPPLSVNDDEIAASLAAAEMLTRLQEIEVPADVTRRLEATLRTRVSARRPVQLNSLASLNENVLPPTRRRSSERTHREPKRRAWIAIGGVAAMLILAFAGLLALSAHTLPGGSGQGGNQVISPTTTIPAQSRVNVDIALLRSALVDLSADVNDQRSDAVIQRALQTVASRSHDCQNAMAAVPTGSERDATQQDLNAALAEEERTVRQLLGQVDWPMRLLFTRQLGVLGDAVPTITHASAHVQQNGTVLITLTGTHFASQARLMVNGKSDGTVIKVLSDQLVASIPLSQGSPGTHAFGVLNPDGTAAQFIYTGEDDHNGPGTPDT